MVFVADNDGFVLIGHGIGAESVQNWNKGCYTSLERYFYGDSKKFLTHLASLYAKTKLHGTVYVTMKQYHGENKPKPRTLKSTDANPYANGEPRCLFRATNGKKKISTVVMHKDVNKFQQAYSSLLKSNIDNLKKRDKKTKKLKKAKATQ